jgi:hypothetical protein
MRRMMRSVAMTDAAAILEIIALTAAGIFTGGALLVSVAEQPARLALEDQPMLVEWRKSYDRAAPMQASLALLTGAAGLAAWWMEGSDWALAGAVTILACWPFVLIVVMPVNRKLKSLALDQASSARPVVERWGRLHAVRSALGILATFAFAMAVRVI